MRRTLAAPIVALVLVPVLAACGSQSSPGGQQTPADGGTTPVTSSVVTPSGTPTTTAQTGAPMSIPEARLGDISLAATMHIGFAEYPKDPGIRRLPGLVVDYTIRNHGTESLVAYDVIPGSLGSAALTDELNPEHAWVFVQGDVLRVSKQGFVSNVEFIAAPVVGAKALAAGGTVKGRAFVPMPPKLDVPSSQFEAPRSAIAPALSSWQFCVQVEPLTGQPRTSASNPEVLEVPVREPSAQTLVCTEAQPLVQP